MGTTPEGLDLDALTAWFAAHVAEAGDTPLTDTIVWYVDGNVVQTGGTMLTGALFSRGNDVWFEATTNDGTESSTPPRESNHVFVLNTPASITSVVLRSDGARVFAGMRSGEGRVYALEGDA